jgi:F-type H+-transporting ATPase subunit b
MHIDLWTLGLQAINVLVLVLVLVLVWLLARFLFRPIVAIVAQRRQAADVLLADATAMRATARAEAAEIAQQRQVLAGEAKRLRADAHKDAETDRAAQLAKAREEVAQARQEGERALARECTQQQQQLEARACILAVDIARRLMTRLPSAVITTTLARRLAQEIAALPAAERRLFAADADHLQLVTSVALDAAGQKEILSVLAEALSVQPKLDIRVDAALLGGIELTGPHTLIRSSWRADLERIANELTEHANAA